VKCQPNVNLTRRDAPSLSLSFRGLSSLLCIDPTLHSRTMLKRLGISPSSETLLLAPGITNSQRTTSPERSSSTDSSQLANVNVIERPALEKSIRALESMLGALNEFSELTARMVKCQKRIARCCKEMATGLKEEGVKEPSVIGQSFVNGMLSKRDADLLLESLDSFPSVRPTASSLSSSGALFEALSDVDSKFVKMVQREYDTANDACGKVFKKIAASRMTFRFSPVLCEASGQLADAGLCLPFLSVFRKRRSPTTMLWNLSRPRFERRILRTKGASVPQAVNARQLSRIR
jgi:hypothetical protein